MKFQVGDIVSILSDNPHGTDLYEGDKKTITEISNFGKSLRLDDRYWVQSTDVKLILSISSESLTKREQIAAMAMQGLISSEKRYTSSISHIVDTSIEYADALLERLKQ